VTATYKNVTEQPIDVEYTANGVGKGHTVAPGQIFVFDENAGNGDDIREQLEAAGAQQQT
jgi:hypothetical protein